MQSIDGRLIVSASDLVGFLGCEHLTVLDQGVAEGRREKPAYRDDPQLELLQKRGREHEDRCLDRLLREGRTIRELARPGNSVASLDQAEATTLAAMREGIDVVYQGTLFGGRWRGHPDFLLRVETPSDLGRWSYEPADAKLASRVEATALLQLCVYADRLQSLQGTAPERVHVVTGDGALHPHRLADYGAYYRAVKRRFEERVFGGVAPPDNYPEPVDHCDICRWWLTCNDRRRAAGDPMKAITLRNLPPDAAKAVRQKARREGLSLNRAVIRLLEETAGRSGGRKELHHDLDHLAGSWSEQEYDAFMEALRDQRRIDPEMWR